MRHRRLKIKPALIQRPSFSGSAVTFIDNVLIYFFFTLSYPLFFLSVHRAYIRVRVIDDEEYEKNEMFYVELGEPRLVSNAAGKENDILENITVINYYQFIFKVHFYVLCG